MTMDIMEAFRRTLWTWKSWATQKLDPERSNIFFRSYSPIHYRHVYLLLWALLVILQEIEGLDFASLRKRPLQNPGCNLIWGDWFFSPLENNGRL